MENNFYKYCGKCKKTLHVSMFFKNKTRKDGYQHYCKKCRQEYRKKWEAVNKEKVRAERAIYRSKNRERLLEYGRNYAKTNKLARKDYQLQYLYGISLEEYNTLLKSQNYSCAICKIHQDNYKRTFHVDHNHRTTKVRGLLCSKCNQGIGLLDSVENLHKAIIYIKNQ